jgi:pimeloyl-ACP methyl ester carboxylesterase
MASVTCPILQIHGARDGITPIELGRKLYEAAPPRSATGVPKRFVELAAAGHNDVVFVAGQEVEQAIREFLESVKSGQESRSSESLPDEKIR